MLSTACLVCLVVVLVAAVNVPLEDQSLVAGKLQNLSNSLNFYGTKPKFQTHAVNEGTLLC
jgi:hypothetical protein